MKHITNHIQGKKLASHYEKYLRDRDESSKSAPTSFDKKLKSTDTATSRAVTRKTESGEGLPKKKQAFPQRVAESGSRITLTQAQRLAKYAPLIQGAAQRHNVPIELICGVILQESGGNYRAKSHAGAQGLMQLMPATARRFGVTDSYDPAQNIEGGVKYLRFLLDRFKGNLELTLAGYNAGEGNVAKYGNKIPPFRETQNYVPAVLRYTQSMIDIISASQLQPMRAELPSYARRA